MPGLIACPLGGDQDPLGPEPGVYYYEGGLVQARQHPAARALPERMGTWLSPPQRCDAGLSPAASTRGRHPAKLPPFHFGLATLRRPAHRGREPPASPEPHRPPRLAARYAGRSPILSSDQLFHFGREKKYLRWLAGAWHSVVGRCVHGPLS